jgi:hypothetical protein
MCDAGSSDKQRKKVFFCLHTAALHLFGFFFSFHDIQTSFCYMRQHLQTYVFDRSLSRKSKRFLIGQLLEFEEKK